MQKIRRDDTVQVMSGKDRGRQGQVRQVFPREQRVIVQGINMVKRHRAQRSPTQPGGIIEKEAPIHWSNVRVVCKSCNRPARVGFRFRPDGVKVRVCKRCGADLD